MNICNKITNYLIKKEIIQKEDKDIYLYGIFVLLYNLLLILNILFLGLLFCQLEYSILFLIFWTPYRILVGGSHCSTPFRCWVFFNIYYFISYYIYIKINITPIIILNSLLMLIQFFAKKENIYFMLLWIAYYILILLMPSQFQKILSIAYLMNSILTIHKYTYKKEFIC